MDNFINNIIPMGALVLSIYSMVRKDNSKLGSMETKIDMLLINSTEYKNDIKNHSEKLAQHEVKIKDHEKDIENVKTDVSHLQDTLRIRKIVKEDLR
jgi:peptidoglycan hydrolase CwlO-like protein